MCVGGSAQASLHRNNLLASVVAADDNRLCRVRDQVKLLVGAEMYFITAPLHGLYNSRSVVYVLHMNDIN